MTINKLLAEIYKLPDETEQIQSLTQVRDGIVIVTDRSVYRMVDERPMASFGFQVYRVGII